MAKAGAKGHAPPAARGCAGFGPQNSACARRANSGFALPAARVTVSGTGSPFHLLFRPSASDAPGPLVPFRMVTCSCRSCSAPPVLSRPPRLLYLDSGATAPGTTNGAGAFMCYNCNIVVSGPEGRLWQAVATGLAEDNLPAEW